MSRVLTFTCDGCAKKQTGPHCHLPERWAVVMVRTAGWADPELRALHTGDKNFDLCPKCQWVLHDRLIVGGDSDWGQSDG